MRAMFSHPRGVMFAFFCAGLLLIQTVAAQDGEPTYQEKAAALVAEIDALVAETERLQARLVGQEGDYAVVLARRAEERALAALQTSNELVGLVVERERPGSVP